MRRIERMGTSLERRLTRQLERLDVGSVLVVRVLPRIVADWYGIVDDKSITISGRTRNYYSRGHPWLRDKHGEVIRTLLYPRQIVQDKANANRVLFYRQSVEKLDVLVVVEIKKARGISHRVVTAFEVGQAEVARRKPMEHLLWEWVE